MQNKTKIIATIGPASCSKQKLNALITAGVNVCRINFSHGSHDDYAKIIKIIREINENLNLHTAILTDLQGPKLRIGQVKDNKIKLVKGNHITLTTKKCVGTAEKIYITYMQFPEDIIVGAKILVDDGKIILKALKTNKKDEVKAEIIQGGILSSNKGINLPNTRISLPCLTEKDLSDLKFALENDVEWIGLSFVRSASDIVKLKELIAGQGKKTKVIAKIEKPQAVRDIDNIIKEADGLMVARGDLGVEVPMQDVPLIQKEIVKKCQQAAKPVIIATQMMESMVKNMTPTRAEVNDVANAVMDGADAVMLSSETSVGKYPVEAIRTMYKIVEKAETFEEIYNKDHLPGIDHKRIITDWICYNACKLAQRVSAKAIITMSFTGYTGFKVSSHRPKANIFVFTANRSILNTLSMIWGVRGIYYNKFESTDNTITDIKRILKKQGLISENDLVINITSMPIAEKGESNMLKLSYVK